MERKAHFVKSEPFLDVCIAVGLFCKCPLGDRESFLCPFLDNAQVYHSTVKLNSAAALKVSCLTSHGNRGYLNSCLITPALQNPWRLRESWWSNLVERLNLH